MLRKLISQSLSLFAVPFRTLPGRPVNKVQPNISGVKTTNNKVVKTSLNSSTLFNHTLSSWVISTLTGFYYSVELLSLLVGILTTLISVGIYCHPDFIGIIILPVLTTFLTNYQISMFLSFLGIEWFPESSQTWLEYFWLVTNTSFNWSTWLITTVVNYPLVIFDHVMSTLVWWNTFVMNFILTGFGVMGLWAFLKVASIIKFIYASTIAAMTAGNLVGFIPSILTFSMQTLILAFVDPIAALINNPSLGSLVTFILPDPMGIWNAFVSINLLPWTIFREFAISPGAQGVINLMLQGLIPVWNFVIQDITWFQINTVLQISSNPADIVTYIFGPLDQRLGQIISSVQSLRSLWR